MSYGKTTLGYWGVRGRAQVARLLLAYTGAVWENVKYTNPAQWFGGDKESLGLDFPNMPYLIDNDVKITESRAINIYIVERSNKKELLGKDLKDRATVLNIEGVLNDVWDNLFKALSAANG
jgi:glutathione S-transferase